MATAASSHQRRGQHEADDAHGDVDRALDRAEEARLAEPVGEDQPARSQVLDRDLAGVFLVDRREVVERDALELHLEQLVHRQLAARVRQADDDAIDAARAHDARNVLDRADDARIEQRRPDLAPDRDRRTRRSRRRARGGARRARAPDRRAAGLVPTSSSRSRGPTRPLSHSKDEAPADDDGNHQHRGDQEHAAADHQAGNPEVEHREDERRRAERLDQAHEQLAPVRRDARSRRGRRSTGRSARSTTISSDLEDPVVSPGSQRRPAAPRRRCGRDDDRRDHQAVSHPTSASDRARTPMDEEADHRRAMSAPPRSL